MCLQCHMVVTPDSAVEELKRTLDDCKFDEWNTTSLSHILLAVRGLDGPKAHELANELAEKFYKWFVGNSWGMWQLFYSYQPRTGLEPFPSSSKIREMIDDANSFYAQHKDKSKEEKIKILTNRVDSN